MSILSPVVDDQPLDRLPDVIVLEFCSRCRCEPHHLPFISDFDIDPRHATHFDTVVFDQVIFHKLLDFTLDVADVIMHDYKLFVGNFLLGQALLNL